tara:strand:- start:2396 stop:2527 length:132 start_codon:yes stop_codon:yes gene_type:complete
MKNYIFKKLISSVPSREILLEFLRENSNSEVDAHKCKAAKNEK